MSVSYWIISAGAVFFVATAMAAVGDVWCCQLCQSGSYPWYGMMQCSELIRAWYVCERGIQLRCAVDGRKRRARVCVCERGSAFCDNVANTVGLLRADMSTRHPRTFHSTVGCAYNWGPSSRRPSRPWPRLRQSWTGDNYPQISIHI